MKLCRRCAAPVTALNVILDRNGVCNLCHTYEQTGAQLTDTVRMAGLFRQRLELFRGRHAYDALVGLSGGKDSSYVALRLVREHGLKVLLFTYDNGYMSEGALRNIELVVEKLQQDHVFVSPSFPLKSAIARASLRRLGTPCIGCTFPGFLAAIKVAMEHEIPMIVHGRSPAQMFKELAPGTTDPFLPFLVNNFVERDEKKVRDLMKSMLQRLVSRFRRLIGGEMRNVPGLSSEAERFYAADPAMLDKLACSPEFLGYFLFFDYDEHQIKDTLEKELGWQRPADDRFMGHEDCLVHAAAVYLYTRNFGHPILHPELATLVRQGRMTREAALARLNQEVEAHRFPLASFKFLEAASGCSSEEMLASARRSQRLLKIFRWSLRLRHHLFRNWLSNPLPPG